MVNIHRKMKEKRFASHLIMQIHDELVFEVKEEELEPMKELVKHEMEHVIELAVPLRVSVGTGRQLARSPRLIPACLRAYTFVVCASLSSTSP